MDGVEGLVDLRRGSDGDLGLGGVRGDQATLDIVPALRQIVGVAHAVDRAGHTLEVDGGFGLARFEIDDLQGRLAVIRRRAGDEFDVVGKAVGIGIAVAIRGVVRVEAMGQFVFVGHAVAVDVRIQRIGHPVAVGIGVAIGQGFLAKKAVELGLEVKPWVKTSLAPGSQVVTDYLEKAGLNIYLDKLGFNLVGYGCTTCIGNSGPLPENIVEAIQKENIYAVSVLSGNRNFEGRISPHIKANYLASPPLVVAYALAGHMGFDLYKDSFGKDKNGKEIFMKDIWPSNKEIEDTLKSSLNADMFIKRYSNVSEGPKQWQQIKTEKSSIYNWEENSTYVKKPPFFDDLTDKPEGFKKIHNARPLLILGDMVTTDHISPAGNIQKESPTGEYFMKHQIQQKEFQNPQKHGC